MVAERRHTTSQLSRNTAIFVALACGLTIFGVLMIYSASSIMALTMEATNYNAAFYAVKQMGFATIGSVLAFILWRFDYRILTTKLLGPIWIVTVLLLMIVMLTSAGEETYGATRWIRLGPLTVQPSEFAKATVLIAAAHLIEQYMADPDADFLSLVIRVMFICGVPLALVFFQPDKGTVLVIGLTCLVMAYIAGFDKRLVLAVVGAGIFALLAIAMGTSYSRARILIMNDPWSDPYGDGYQLIQGFYAFGSGGLTGVGLGMSRQKYAYLPMAHNDFIFAVIGEELGFVGAVILLAVFCALVYMGYRIASEAVDLTGRLIASGAVSMLVLQLLVNVSGVLGIIPLSGKPIPFISYGGSSIMSTLILVGLVLSVSRVASTEQAGRRSSDFMVVEGRGARSLRVIDGGGLDSYGRGRSTRDLRAASGESTRLGVGRSDRRINLGPSASDRLRRRS